MENYITGIIAILSFIVSHILNMRSEKVRFKRTRFIEKEKERNKIETELALKKFDQRNQDIKEIYLFLLKMKKYYNLFCEHNSEFIKREEYKNFAPLGLWTEFGKVIEDKELFLDDEIIERLYILYYSLHAGNNIAIYLNDESEEIAESLEKLVEDYCAETILKIEDIMNYLKSKI